MDRTFNECTSNYWFCPTCTKPTLNAVFLDKDMDERCKVFLDSIKARITNLESEQFSTKNFVKVLEDTLEKNNLAVTCYIEMLDSLNERVNTIKKVPNESSNTESSLKIEVNNKENSNTNQKQDKLVLMNQLKEK